MPTGVTIVHDESNEVKINFWGFTLNIYCSIFCVLFFRLLLTSLSLSVETQRFGRFILRPFSGVACLSGYANDSTWKIIFKIWLLVKQEKGTRIYNSNNNLIDFHVYQSKKHRRKISWKASWDEFETLNPISSVFDILNVSLKTIWFSIKKLIGINISI